MKFIVSRATQHPSWHHHSDTLQFLFHSSGPIEEGKVQMLLKIVTSHSISISVCGAASDTTKISPCENVCSIFQDGMSLNMHYIKN